MLCIRLAETDEQILACFPVVAQLRPHLRQEDFVDRVRRQARGGYQLAAGQANEKLVCVAGFRPLEQLAHGKILYIDDLVTADDVRSSGYGLQMLDWLLEYARAHECDELQLDSGVQRFAAHRFYFREGMHIHAYHFRKAVR